MQSIQYLMSLLDENKHLIKEDLYLDTCSLLKDIYEKQANNNDCQEYYIKLEYVNGIQNIILEEKSYLPFHNMIIKYKEDEAYKIDIIESIIYDLIFMKLSCNTYEKIIKKFGGEEEAYRKMKMNIEDYDYFRLNIFNCAQNNIQKQYMAYHILDTIIVEYDHITNHAPNHYINIDDFICICSEFY